MITKIVLAAAILTIVLCYVAFLPIRMIAVSIKERHDNG